MSVPDKSGRRNNPIHKYCYITRLATTILARITEKRVRVIVCRDYSLLKITLYDIIFLHDYPVQAGKYEVTP
jgi:hypothetical protein